MKKGAKTNTGTRLEAETAVAKVIADARKRTGREPTAAEIERWAAVYVLVAFGLRRYLAERETEDTTRSPKDEERPAKKPNDGRNRDPRSPFRPRPVGAPELEKPVEARPGPPPKKAPPPPEKILAMRPDKPPPRPSIVGE